MSSPQNPKLEQIIAQANDQRISTESAYRAKYREDAELQNSMPMYGPFHALWKATRNKSRESTQIPFLDSMMIHIANESNALRKNIEQNTKIQTLAQVASISSEANQQATDQYKSQLLGCLLVLNKQMLTDSLFGSGKRSDFRKKLEAWIQSDFFADIKPEKAIKDFRDFYDKKIIENMNKKPADREDPFKTTGEIRDYLSKKLEPIFKLDAKEILVAITVKTPVKPKNKMA